MSSCTGMERTYEAPSNEAPHMIPGYHQGRLVTYLQNNFSMFRQWQPAKPRNGMTSVLNFCNFQCQFQFLYRFRNLSSWERYGFVEREGSASNSPSFALAMAMAAFHCFSGPLSDLPIVFARKMHSTTKLAMTVLSKCVTHAGFVKVA